MPHRELDEVKPTFVVNAAGITGRPNVDWCEDHKAEVLRVNVIGTMSLMDLTCQRGIHMTNFGTGCIYSYDDEHPIGGKTFTEEDPANFFGSFYSRTKAMVESMAMESYDNVLMLRLRMPISDDLHHRSFVTKISTYAKVVDIPNSMSVLTDLLPIALTMTERRLKGKYNFTNPGAISHNEILALYKEVRPKPCTSCAALCCVSRVACVGTCVDAQYIDPTFWWDNFTEAEQNAILKSGRSNNTLSTDKLVDALPDIRVTPIKEAIVGVFQRMRDNLKAADKMPKARGARPEPVAAAAAAGTC